MKSGSVKTAAGPDSSANKRTTRPPILFRLPKPGEVDPFFSANRSFWNEIILPTEANGFKPPVKSVVDRRPGNTKGRRFVLFDSAKAYFDRLLTEAEREAEELAKQHAARSGTEAA